MLSPLQKAAWGLPLCSKATGIRSEKREIHSRLCCSFGRIASLSSLNLFEVCQQMFLIQLCLSTLTSDELRLIGRVGFLGGKEHICLLLVRFLFLLWDRSPLILGRGFNSGGIVSRLASGGNTDQNSGYILSTEGLCVCTGLPSSLEGGGQKHVGQ